MSLSHSLRLCVILGPKAAISRGEEIATAYTSDKILRRLSAYDE